MSPFGRLPSVAAFSARFLAADSATARTRCRERLTVAPLAIAGTSQLAAMNLTTELWSSSE